MRKALGYLVPIQKWAIFRDLPRNGYFIVRKIRYWRGFPAQESTQLRHFDLNRAHC
jgi:hypothetical protein